MVQLYNPNAVKNIFSNDLKILTLINNNNNYYVEHFMEKAE